MTLQGPLEPAFVEARADVWQKIRAHLERLVEYEGRFGMTVTGLATRIQNGTLRVWVLGDYQAIFLTSLYQQQNGRFVCSLSWAAGGAGDEIRSNFAGGPNAILPPIEAYARLNGCYAVEIMGRPGWERVTRNLGYAPLARTVMKEL